jgi:protein-L-isoaspartate(D-aspartate) O-methyltransferase
MRKHPAVNILIAIILAACFMYSLGAHRRDRIDFEKKRIEMVRRQLQARDINDQRVLDAMGRVPRHLFVDKRYWNDAYADHPLPIDEGQTISQPYIVALMTQYLNLKEEDKVLEIGTGSGYQAAVLAEIVDEVYSIEIREGLAEKAAETLKDLNFSNVSVKCADGYFGWKEHAPFDAIIVTCAVNHIPPPLLDQLNEGGKLIIPLGSTLYYQTLTLITKEEGKPLVEHITSVRFVPMTGEAQRGK